MKSTEAAQAARFAWTREMMKTDEGLEQWVAYMVAAIRRATARQTEKLFRIHDSGDFFSPRYARAWRMVCGQLPEVDFWAPFRGWQLPTGSAVDNLKPFRVLDESDLLLAELLAMAALPNVTLRPSALNFGEPAPEIPGFHAGSAASNSHLDGHYECPAQSQGNNCGSCRVCWHSKSTRVRYHEH